MAATAAQILEVRRMCALAAGDTTYIDSLLTTYIERYPHLDERGEYPYTYDGSTEPPTQEDNDSWIPTYDLHAAARDVWQEKAADLADKFDANSDGSSLKRSQLYEQAMKQARYHASRMMARTMTAHKWPKENSSGNFPWIGNLPEVDD